MTESAPQISTIKFWNSVLAFVMLGAAASILFQETGGTCGDYPQHFHVLYEGMAIGLVLGFIITFYAPKIQNGFIAWELAITLIRYFLACILLSYGIVKVFATQFPHMMANMDARFIELTPMRVAWTFFGYSKEYQMFLGWGEVIPALMLLSRRTSLLGALFVVIVMLNVYLINVFFDVCVKLNSFIYMGLGFFILMQNFSRMWTFFITNKLTPPEPRPEIVHPFWLKMSFKIFNILFVAVILLWAAMKSYETMQYSTRLASLPSVQGAWRIAKIERNEKGTWRDIAKSDSLCANRLFFEGSLGVIQNDLVRDRFILAVDEPTKMLTLTFRTKNNEFEKPVKWRFDLTSPDSLALVGRWRGDSVRIESGRRTETLLRY